MFVEQVGSTHPLEQMAPLTCLPVPASSSRKKKLSVLCTRALKSSWLLRRVHKLFSVINFERGSKFFCCCFQHRCTFHTLLSVCLWSCKRSARWHPQIATEMIPIYACHFRIKPFISATLLSEADRIRAMPAWSNALLIASSDCARSKMESADLPIQKRERMRKN